MERSPRTWELGPHLNDLGLVNHLPVMGASLVRKLSILFPRVLVKIKRENTHEYGLKIIKVCELEP